jgi:hypothetical protein
VFINEKISKLKIKIKNRQKQNSNYKNDRNKMKLVKIDGSIGILISVILVRYIVSTSSLTGLNNSDNNKLSKFTKQLLFRPSTSFLNKFKKIKINSIKNSDLNRLLSLMIIKQQKPVDIQISKRSLKKKSSNHFNGNKFYIPKNSNLRFIKKRNVIISSSSSPTTLTTTTTTKDNDEPQQYCGETLYYVVEHYCSYVVGTGIYSPSYYDQDVEELKIKRKSSELNPSFFFELKCFH